MKSINPKKVLEALVGSSAATTVHELLAKHADNAAILDHASVVVAVAAGGATALGVNYLESKDKKSADALVNEALEIANGKRFDAKAWVKELESLNDAIAKHNRELRPWSEVIHTRPSIVPSAPKTAPVRPGR